MRRVLVAGAAVAMLAAIAGLGLAAQGETIVFVGHDKVAAGGTVVTAPNLIIQVNKRTGPGMSELHDKETDTFHILSGSATFVVGGTMVDSKVTDPGQQRGASIRGGQEYHLQTGDVMVIPAGTPHWFKEVPNAVEYYVVKVLKP